MRTLESENVALGWLAVVVADYNMISSYIGIEIFARKRVFKRLLSKEIKMPCDDSRAAS
jgi:hypothetical protein